MDWKKIRTISLFLLLGISSYEDGVSRDFNVFLAYVDSISVEDGFKAKRLLDSVIFNPKFSSLSIEEQIDTYFKSSYLTLKLHETKPKIFAALSDVNKAYQLSKDYEDSYREVKSLDLIASCYYYLAVNNKSENFIDSLNKFHEISINRLPYVAVWEDSVFCAAEVLNTKALSLITESHDDAIHFIKKSNNLFKKVNNLDGLGRTFFNLSARFQRKSKTDSISIDSALFYINKSISVYSDIGNRNDLYACYESKGNYYIFKYFWSNDPEDLNKAIQNHRLAIDIFPSKSCQSFFRVAESFHWKSRNNGLSGKTKSAAKDSAIKYYQKTILKSIPEQDKKCLELTLYNYVSLLDTITSEDETIYNIFEGLGQISEEEKAELLLAESDLRNFRINQVERENSREKQIYLIGGSVTLAVLLGLTLIFYQRIRIRHLKQQLRSRLERLRAQVDPHFISNCLNAIELLINENKPKRAADYLIEFSRLCRGILYSTTNDNIILAQEIDQLKSYISLEQLRIGDKLHYEFVVSPEINSNIIIVPTLLIQPFIENAIWHGIQKKGEGGKVMVEFSQTMEDGKEVLYCRVEDNGIGRKASMSMEKESIVKKEESYGLSITDERIQILDRIKQAKYKITDLYEKNQPTGTLVEIWLPIIHP